MRQKMVYIWTLLKKHIYPRKNIDEYHDYIMIIMIRVYFVCFHVITYTIFDPPQWYN
jgi:hypothetical protein